MNLFQLYLNYSRFKFTVAKLITQHISYGMETENILSSVSLNIHYNKKFFHINAVYVNKVIAYRLPDIFPV